MKHFGAVCGPGASHIATMSAVGRELQARGHQLTLFDFSDALKPTKDSTTNLVTPAEGATQSGSAFLGYMKKRARWICENAPALFAHAKLDCLLVDAIDPATATIGEMMQIPYVTINNALPINAEPLVPPDFLPWRFHNAWWARLRNAAAYKIRDFIISPLNRVLNDYRRQWNLRSYRTPNDSLSTLAQITQLIREFDLPRTCLPRCFHYVGPYHRERNVRIDFPYNRLDHRPLIYASLGTHHGNLLPLWQKISESCAGLEAQLVIALGGHDLSQRMSLLPGNPLIVNYAPQIDLLARAALTITHGGLNSTMEALAAGTPMVVLPITGDQFGVAARVIYTGIGKVVIARNCQVQSLRQTVQTVLTNDSYRQRILSLKKTADQTSGIHQAANIVEEVAVNRQPVFA